MVVSYYVFDWKRTLYDPDTDQLIDGALDVLGNIYARNIPMALVGKGDSDMYTATERLGVKKYFKDIHFEEGDKQSSQYDAFIDKQSPRNTVFIGDRINSEIAVGSSMGATTIWVKQGKFADELPEASHTIPTYTVGSLQELNNLLAMNFSLS